MNDRVRLLIDEVLANTSTPSAKSVWLPTAVLPGMFFLGGLVIFVGNLYLYNASCYGMAFDSLLLFFVFAYGCSFSTRVIYKLSIVSQLPGNNLRGLPIYVENALRKIFYVFMFLYLCVLSVSVFFVFNLFLSNFAMLLYFVLNVMLVKVIYSVFVLNLQRILIPFAGGFASKLIDKQE